MPRSPASSESSGSGSPGAGVRVRVSLARFVPYGCVVWARRRRRARWLLRRVRAAAPLPPRALALQLGGFLLPPAEPLALLQHDDLLEVIEAPWGGVWNEDESRSDATVQHLDNGRHEKTAPAAPDAVDCGAGADGDGAGADMDGAGADGDGAWADMDGAGADGDGAWADMDGAGTDGDGAWADMDGAGADGGGAGAEVDGAGEGEAALRAMKRRALALLEQVPPLPAGAPPAPRRRRVRRRRRASPARSPAPAASPPAVVATPRSPRAPRLVSAER